MESFADWRKSKPVTCAIRARHSTRFVDLKNFMQNRLAPGLPPSKLPAMFFVVPLISLSLLPPMEVREDVVSATLALWGRDYAESRRKVRLLGAAMPAVQGILVPSLQFELANGRQVFVSEEAVALILRFEIVSENYYTRFLEKGHVPKNGRSGVTVGLGFDLGQHSPEMIRQVFSGKLSRTEIDRLAALAGLRGDKAREAFEKMEKVVVPLEMARDVFLEWILPEVVGHTVRIFPETATLHPDAAGALVSLVFNRGSALASKELQADGTDRRAGMATIKALLAGGKFAEVPEEIRRMKEIVEANELGLKVRREAEAALFQKAFPAPEKPTAPASEQQDMPGETAETPTAPETKKPAE